MSCYLLFAAGLFISSFTNGAENALCFGALRLDLPVRYLHIQLRYGETNITQSVGPLKVSVLGSCRHRFQLLDYHDGSYVLRLRLWSSCLQMVINIHTPNGVPLCDSPIVIKKADGSLLYSEYCDCPKRIVSQWMQESGCTSQHSQLDSDLSQWSTINFEEVLTIVKKKWASPQHRRSSALCHYQIIENNLYRQCFGEYTGFRIFVDAAFTSLMRKMYLPNTEFIFNLGDWPLAKAESDLVPMISWCGSKDTADIVMPTYELMKSVIDSMESVILDIHSVRGEKHYRWEQKKDKAVFRGRDSSKLRLHIAQLSKLHPNLLDAGITRYFFFNESQHMPTVETIPFPNFFEYKFILSIDGTVAAYRFPFLLAGDSIVFKSFSDYYEHFYADLEEGLHYFHFSDSTLIEQIKWARTQDHNKTLNAMRQFVLQHLQPLNVYCYYADFVQKYTSKLEKIPTQPQDGMELIPKIPSDKQSTDQSCDCSNQMRSGGSMNNKQEL
ncbi:KDEL domain-containing protein-containing protein 2 [Wuchereria bancrofti]|uniref:KDEL domain-containing protein-containing protein 2 n=2 Tax=Wuchereria bancrofti TaxID=6293 RepID=J9FFP3_WUCBA|nr:KDEL domain-containing protein-containing protein 2 [Wuchereria bancrofti]